MATRAEQLAKLRAQGAKVKSRRYAKGESQARRAGIKTQSEVKKQMAQAGKKTIRWKVTPNPDGPGFQGVLEIPMGVGPFAATSQVRAHGPTQGGALQNAASVASSILDNPILKAALPPGTGAAIEATKMLSKYADADLLESGMKLLKGAGAKRIGKAIKKLKFW